MKALLLAAGLGTRLRPITDTMPKCLVPINAKPLLEYWLDTLSKIGIEKCLINTHYKHKMVEDYISKSGYKDFCAVTFEKELLLTAGTLLKNKKFFISEPLMLIHADNLSICDYTAFIKAHKNRPKGCEITMMTFKTQHPENCGVVQLDDEGIVQEFYEKIKNPPTSLANAAVYIIEPSIFTFLESLEKDVIDFSTEVLPHYLGKIFTFHNDVYHRDIGTVDDYAQAQIDILKF